MSSAGRDPSRPQVPDESAPLDSFELLVERVLDSLPPQFQRLLADVAIVIEDVSEAGQSYPGGPPAEAGLYGLYEGVPGIEWGADMAPFPNKITLFRVPLETDFPDPDQLADEVRKTVLHELAHHAGITDERLHELDSY